MSFSSILSSNIVDPPKSSVKKQTPPVKQFRRSSKTPNGDVAPSPVTSASTTSHPLRKPSKESPRPTKMDYESHFDSIEDIAPLNAKVTPAKVSLKPSPKDNEKVLKALADIDSMEHSDVDAPGWSEAREQHRQRGLKRHLDIEVTESNKRKVSPVLVPHCSLQC